MESKNAQIPVPDMEVDEFGVPVLSPEEMYDKLNEITGYNGTETAELISDSLYDQKERLEKKKYKSTDPNEILAEAAQRKGEVEKLYKQWSYWSSVRSVGWRRETEYQKKELAKAAAERYAAECAAAENNSMVVLWVFIIVMAVIFLYLIFD